MQKRLTLQTDRWGIAAVLIFWSVLLVFTVGGLFLYFSRR
jgi:hypothetical protein